MVEPTARSGDVALFIDWENFKISLAVGNRSPNLSALKEEVSNQGRVVVAKAYADWVTRAPELRGASQFFNDPPSLYAAGIEPVFVPTRIPSTQASSANGMRTYRVKNSVDVKMTADCIECAHSYPNITTFVLVSGDSDFLHVVNALRTMGKHVVIIGVSWSTSRRLADQVDSLLLYDKDVDPIAPQPAVLPQHVNRGETQKEEPELAEVIRAIEEIVREERAADGQPLLTSIKQRMMRRYPSFDEKKLGFSGFKKLMARAAEDGNIKLIHSGLVDWAIMSDEETPEGTSEETPSGVAAKPGRRRGGRRRHGTQRDAEVDGADIDADADAEDLPVSAVAEDTAPVADFVDVLEETAATDFDLPEIDDTESDDVQDTVEPEALPDVFDEDAPAEVADEETTAEIAAEPEEEAPPEDVFDNDPELAAAVQEALSSVGLPAEPEDGKASERVSDLIVMADHLEHRQGVSHVAFNFLVAEVCSALEQGLEAGNNQIAQRWADASGRDYISKMLRSLSDGGFFRRSVHSWRDESSGRRRQRRTFNLDRDNALVGRMLEARLGPAANSTPPMDPADTVSEPEETGEAPLPVDVLPEPEQLALVDGESSNGAAPVDEEPAAVAEDVDAEPNPPAEDLDEEPTPPAEDLAEEPTPPAADVDDDYHDEPQPRSTRRRRPFTSRLLRS